MSAHLSVGDIEELFNRARSELFIGPLNISVKIEGATLTTRFKGRRAEISVPPRLIGDPEGGAILLWYFRHNLAHVHYCPYNFRTVLTLSRAAVEEVGDWRLAYNAVALFSDLQVDLLYLPLRYRQIPLHLQDEFQQKPKGISALRYATCLHVYKDALKRHRVHRDVLRYGSILSEIILSYRPWTTKVKTIAAILKRLRDLVSLKQEERLMGGMPLSEDLESDVLGEARRAIASTSSGSEAREFYYNVLRERLDAGKMIEELKETLKKGLGKEEGKAEGYVPGKAGEGEEPELPSALSRPLKRVREPEEAIWRSLWYRALAERVLIEYGEGSPRGTWAIYAYTDLWSIDDEAEELDLEASMEEGPIIPEVTTLKSIYIPSPSGEVVASAKSPTTLIILDSSKSMLPNMDEASIAAYVAYVSARRMGGKVAVINFSTRYVAVDWEQPEVRKELAMALRLGELTILPLAAIRRLLGELEPGERATVIIVTDCGWQNIREALGFLEKISSMGHNIVVLHIEGGKYPKSVDMVRKNRYLTLYRVKYPAELKHLVLKNI